MFLPSDWLAVADELASRTDEASRRTAVGRYYYATFLQCLRSLEFDGLYVRRGEGTDHREVARRLALNRRGAASAALSALLELRRVADYDESATVDSAMAVRAGHLAREVERLCSADGARMPGGSP